jgi:hypothetical protein
MFWNGFLRMEKKKNREWKKIITIEVVNNKKKHDKV